MTLLELQEFLDKTVLPCTYAELMTQCELNNIQPKIQEELVERFHDEYNTNTEMISEDDFEELQNYFDEEFYKQDD